MLRHRLRTRCFSTSSTSSRPLRACIVGSGPGGFYTAKYLMKDHPASTIHMIEKLPVPYGLVRFGVAPDHPEVKAVINDFSQVVQETKENGNESQFYYHGNVTLGEDVTLAELQSLNYFDAFIFCTGAQDNKHLNLPVINQQNEAMNINSSEVKGVHSARNFVNWYNGHPEFHNYGEQVDLNKEAALVIGQGNVALDCARILVKSVDELAQTDIASTSLEKLRQSEKVMKKVTVVGRRGHVQAAFTNKEMREMTKLSNVHVHIDQSELDAGLTPASELEIKEARARKRANKLLMDVAKKEMDANADDRICEIKFLWSPSRYVVDEGGHICGVEVRKTRLEGEKDAQRAVIIEDEPPQVIDCGLVLESIGYKSIPYDTIPFDDRLNVIANERGRVHGESLKRPRMYCAGWAKRGPYGIVGTNILDARETVHHVIEDFKTNDDEGEVEAPEKIASFLEERLAKKVLSWEDVEKIHNLENATEPTKKFLTIEEMVNVLN